MRSDQQTSWRKVTTERRYVQVAEQVLQAIAHGALKPGERLPSDRELADSMAVSRPTVREALLALQFLGAVEVRPGDGAYVAGQSASLGGNLGFAVDFAPEPAEVIEARIVIEPAIARLASMRISHDALARLIEMNARAEEIHRDAAHLDEFLRIGLHFHAMLAPHCGNRLLSSTAASLVDIFHQPMWALWNRQAMRDVNARFGQVEEHRRILEAIRTRDPEGAYDAMLQHLQGLEGTISGLEETPKAE